MKNLSKIILLLFVFISGAISAQTPFDEYAPTAFKEILRLPETKYRVYNSDTSQAIRYVEWNKETGILSYYDGQNVQLGSFTPNEIEKKWLSTDPLAKKYPGKSPYNFCSDNPVNHFDNDGRDDFTFHTLTTVTSYKINGEFKTQVNKVTSVEIVKNNQANTYSVHNAVYADDLINKTKTFSESTTGLSNGNNSDAGKLLSENWGAISGQYSDKSMPLGGSNYQTPGYPGAANLKGSYDYNKKEDDNNKDALGIMLGAIPASELFEAATIAKGGAAVEDGANAFSHASSYAPRVRMRGLEDPVSHNFPYSFDDHILSTSPIPKKNGYNIFKLDGTMNGKSGAYEIGVTKDNVIDHRFFRPSK